MADQANGDITARLKDEMPIELGALEVGERAIGLVIVDEVNGFATVGAGNLAPAADNPQVTRMVDETDRLARGFADRGRPILAFLDTHQPGKPEPPYPPHCEAGTGEEELVPKLKWLEDE
ncbi:MAG: isochorismatase family protein, partial [Alphaproteobacteria bacterium]